MINKWHVNSWSIHTRFCREKFNKIIVIIIAKNWLTIIFDSIELVSTRVCFWHKFSYQINLNSQTIHALECIWMYSICDAHWNKRKTMKTAKWAAGKRKNIFLRELTAFCDICVMQPPLPAAFNDSFKFYSHVHSLYFALIKYSLFFAVRRKIHTHLRCV